LATIVQWKKVFRFKKDEVPPAPLRLVLQGHPARAMYIAVKHRLADKVEANGGSMELGALLKAASEISSEDHLYRILRSCESEGIFSVKQDGDTVKVLNTKESRMLIWGAPESLAYLVMHAHYETALALNYLDDIVTSKDKSSKSTAWDFYSPNQPFWAWLDQPEQREARETFNQLMVNVSLREIPHICKGFPWEKFLDKVGGGKVCSVVDVGGGKGHLLKAMMDVATFKPIVFDTHFMIDEAAGFWKGTDVELVKGDFFDPETIPMANVYILKHILHDWSDAKSIDILKSICTKAGKIPNSRVMIIELVLDETKPLAPFESWGDIQMLNVVGGKERSKKQWERDVISKSGLQIEAVHSTGGTECIIECSLE